MYREKNKDEPMLKINKECVILSYRNKHEIIMLEPDIHLTDSVEDTITNRFGLSEKLGRIIGNKTIALYLGKKYPAVKTKTEILTE